MSKQLRKSHEYSRDFVSAKNQSLWDFTELAIGSNRLGY